VRFRNFGRHAQAAADEREQNARPDRRRRSWTAAGVGLITVAAVSALAASAAAPAKDARPTARERPNYLQPVGTLVHHGYLPFPALLGDSGDVGVPAGTKPAPARPDPAVAAQQAPAIAPFQGATGTLTPAGIATLALEHGCDAAAAVTATAIAMAESGGSPSAQGDIGLMTDVWDWSAGLWQIRGLRAERGTGGLRDSVANQDAGTNAAAMYAISRGCTDWTPWSTYNSGVYRQFLPLAEQAVRYVLAYYAAHGRHYPPVAAPDPTASIPVQGIGAPGEAPASTAAPTRHRTSVPKPARSASAPKPAPTAKPSHSAAPSSRPPAPASTAQPAPSKTRISLPLPKPTLPKPTLPKPTLPVPTPSLTLPIPIPSLTLPTLPGLP
jgi:hypothetical protein